MMVFVNFSLVIIFYSLVALNLKRHFPFLVLLWFGHFWMGLSTAFLETGPYITEQRAFGYQNGATFGLILVELPFWITMMLVLKLKIRSDIKEFHFSKKRANLILTITLLVFIALSLNLLLTGSPIFDASLTRFNYWEQSALPFFKSLFGEVASPFLVMLGVVFGVCHYKGEHSLAKGALLLFISFFIYYFFIGHKFSMQFLAICLFFPPFLFLNRYKPDRSKVKLRHVVSLAMGILFLFGFIAWNYINKHMNFIESQGGVFHAILYRFIVLQGHVWWGGYNEYLQLGGFSGFTNITNFLHGLTTMMYVVSPTDLVERYLQSGVRFTMGYPAIVLYSFGFTGSILFQVSAGILLGVLVKTCEKYLLSCSLISSTLLMIMLGNFTILFNMGNFDSLFSAKFLAPFVLLPILIAFTIKKRSGVRE